MDTLSPRHETYAWRGDVLHILTVINTVVFCYCVLFYKDNTALFDPTWAKYGFCVSNRNVNYWNSHDLSFYADTILAVASALCFLRLRKKEGMGLANAYMLPNILGVLFHGFAHGRLGAAMRDEKHEEYFEGNASYMSTIGDKTWETIGQDFVIDGLPFLLFWLVLLKTTMPDSPTHISMPLSLLFWIGSTSMPATFGFTYTQTVLLLSFSVNQLGKAKEDKGFAYLSYAAIVSFGIPLVGWLESTMCSELVIHMGGHLIYDGFIAAAGLAFYLHYYAYRGSETAKAKAE